MQRELGREETLRRLWPMVVGAKLGASTRLVSIRASRLRIAVPDQTWKRELGGLERSILEAVHRASGEEFARSVELVEDPTLGTASFTGETGETKRKAGEAKSRAVARMPRPELLSDVLVGLPLEAIQNGELRRLFEESAAKYLSRAKGAEL
jgi:hypothetical protein